MKLLLDECVTHSLRRDLTGHEVHTVEDAGLKGLENGELLKTAAGVYEVLVTVDPKHSLSTESRRFTHRDPYSCGKKKQLRAPEAAGTSRIGRA